MYILCMCRDEDFLEVSNVAGSGDPDEGIGGFWVPGQPERRNEPVHREARPERTPLRRDHNERTPPRRDHNERRPPNRDHNERRPPRRDPPIWSPPDREGSSRRVDAAHRRDRDRFRPRSGSLRPDEPRALTRQQYRMAEQILGKVGQTCSYTTYII